MITLIIFLTFLAVALVIYLLPSFFDQVSALNQQRVYSLSHKLDRVLSRQKIKQIGQLSLVAPVILAAGFYMFFPDTLKNFGIFLGIVGGFLFPNIYTKAVIAQNRTKFENQLIDALMIMSSSFRGGLSLIQAMEAVVEEMPEPINQEFLTVLGENKMGVSLEEALNHLYYRMPSPALQQMITAILLARETGGNLPAIFQRIVSVIREYKRIQGQIDTLTIQGKIQGVVMSLLPIAFFSVIYTTQPRFFNSMINSKTGQTMLIYACISEIVGAFMIWKISTFKDY